MTTITIQGRARTIFDDARLMYRQALDRLTEGDVRDAAEKAWCATVRSTDALILARTGTEPRISSDTTAGLTNLEKADSAFSTLARRYFSRQGRLHGACFYLGLCEPLADTERRIRETINYIADAERLAFS